MKINTYTGRNLNYRNSTYLSYGDKSYFPIEGLSLLHDDIKIPNNTRSNISIDNTLLPDITLLDKFIKNSIIKESNSDYYRNLNNVIYGLKNAETDYADYRRFPRKLIISTYHRYYLKNTQADIIKMSLSTRREFVYKDIFSTLGGLYKMDDYGRLLPMYVLVCKRADVMEHTINHVLTGEIESTKLELWIAHDAMSRHSRFGTLVNSFKKIVIPFAEQENIPIIVKENIVSELFNDITSHENSFETIANHRKELDYIEYKLLT